jgi:hypothetical protein
MTVVVGLGWKLTIVGERSTGRIRPKPEIQDVGFGGSKQTFDQAI